MSDGPPPDPLARLERRLERARQERTEAGGGRPDAAAEPPGGALGMGLRVGIELVAGLAVGLALGWVCDRFLGTRPWGLIVGFLLGAAGAMLNVFRMAKQIVYGPAPPAGGGRRDRTGK